MKEEFQILCPFCNAPYPAAMENDLVRLFLINPATGWAATFSIFWQV
jgi:hypothetical protein